MLQTRLIFFSRKCETGRATSTSLKRTLLLSLSMSSMFILDVLLFLSYLPSLSFSIVVFFFNFLLSLGVFFFYLDNCIFHIILGLVYVFSDFFLKSISAHWMLAIICFPGLLLQVYCSIYSCNSSTVPHTSFPFLPSLSLISLHFQSFQQKEVAAAAPPESPTCYECGKLFANVDSCKEHWVEDHESRRTAAKEQTKAIKCEADEKDMLQDTHIQTRSLRKVAPSSGPMKETEKAVTAAVGSNPLLE